MGRRLSGDFWSGKCVIVTGASSGIGWAIGELVGSMGAGVGLLARRGERLEQLQRKIEDSGGRAVTAATDVTDLEQVESSVRVCEEKLGPCDVMIANAGIYRSTDGLNFQPATAGRIIATNLIGVVNAFGAVLPGMVKRGFGSAAAVGSIAALLGLPGAGAYSASKAGLVTLLESLRLDLRNSPVKITAICPGFADTTMLTDTERRRIKNILSPGETARRIAHAIEQGRAEYWFPWRTYLSARLAGLLPFWAYRRLVSRLPEMKNADGGEPLNQM